MTTNHNHASPCATSRARNTSSTRFFTKLLAAIAVGLSALMLATPDAEAQVQSAAAKKRAAAAKAAAEQTATAEEPKKTTPTIGADAEKAKEIPMADRVPQTPEAFAEWLGKKLKLDAEKQKELCDELKQVFVKDGYIMEGVIGRAGRVTGVGAREVTKHMKEEGWNPDVYSSDILWVTRENKRAQAAREAAEAAEEAATAKQKQSCIKGYDFSDGVAWVLTQEQQWNCIDKTGKVILALGAREAPESNFSKGVALVKRSDNTIELIDKSGQVISSPKSGEYDSIIGFVPGEGVIIVCKKIETFEVTETRVGIIDNRGQWKINLCTDPNLITVSYLGNGLTLHPNFGEGVILCQLGLSSGEFYYNVRTGDSFTINYYEGNGFSWRWSALRGFENGYGVYFDDSGNLCAVSSKGEKTELKRNLGFDLYSNLTSRNPKTVKIGRYKDGLFYYENETTASNSKAHRLTKGFYDIKGNLVIDLSRYNIPPGDFPRNFQVDIVCSIC